MTAGEISENFCITTPADPGFKSAPYCYPDASVLISADVHQMKYFLGKFM
jgi:hypothetical protein